MVAILPPFSAEMEAAALGAFLIDPEAFTAHGTALTPDRFYRDAHSLIYAAMRALYERGIPIDLLAVTDEVERRGQAEAVGGLDYITQLVTIVPTSAHVEYYVQRVIALAQERDTRRALDEYIKDTYAGLPDALARQQTRLNAIAAYGGKASDTNPYAGHSPAELRQRPPVAWFIDGIIAENTLGMTYGDSESAKSLTWQDIMMHVILGWKWRGRQTAQGHVWYVAAEGANGLTPRLSAWADEHRVQEELTDPYIHITENAVPLMNRGEVLRFIQTIKAHDFSEAPLRLIVFDTLSRCMEGGDENDNNDARDALANAELVQRETGAVVMVIHHSGKNDGYRGASALRANVDTMIKIEAKDGKSIMYSDKQKDGAPHFAAIASAIKGVRRPEWQLEYPVLIPSEYEAPQTTAPKGNDLYALRGLARLGGKATYAQWAKEVNLENEDRYFKHLTTKTAGYVAHEGKYYTLTNKATPHVNDVLPSLPSLPSTYPHEGKSNLPSLPSSSYRDEGNEGKLEGNGNRGVDVLVNRELAEQCACGNEVETVTHDGLSL